MRRFCLLALAGVLLCLLTWVAGAGAATPRADLVVGSLSQPPASVAPGGSFTVTGRVVNRGRAKAKKSTVNFLLSTDKRRGSGDVALASQSVKALKRRKGSRRAVELTVPAFTPDGAYYVIACADGRGKVKEAKESNNCRASRTTLLVTTASATGPSGTGGASGPGTSAPPPAPKPACSNGQDDDGDGKRDRPGDPGCSSATDTSERGTNECDNGKDDSDDDSQADYRAAGGGDPDCTGPSDVSEQQACQDNVDNDGDGTTDWSDVYSDDPGCDFAGDRSERGPPTLVCDNGFDEDDDGAADLPADQGCTLNGFQTHPTSSSERSNALSQCDNGDAPDFYGPGDDDGDTLEDYTVNEYTGDPGCASRNDEEIGTVACDNGHVDYVDGYSLSKIDDDGDGARNFPQDKGCSSPGDTSERSTSPCDDNVDNDGDGKKDYSYSGGDDDPGCINDGDTTETSNTLPCDDLVDNDGDGANNFYGSLPDPGCASLTDTSEWNAAVECDNGVDDDGWGDGIDFKPGPSGDPDCKGRTDPSELPECQDGIDNDGDEKYDYSGPPIPRLDRDPECESAEDPDESPDP